MALPNPQSRLEGIEFSRETLLSQPLGRGISADDTAGYLASLAIERFPISAYANRGIYPCLQPRGGVPLFEDQYDLTRQLISAGADFVPLTIDSYTRHNQYDTAAELLLRSEQEGKNYLNGYPLVTHGHLLTRELYEGTSKPVSLRHGTPDARLLVEVALASGITEIEGGGLCYCLPYSEGFPLDRCLLYWQYIDRICAAHSTVERPIHRESFGPLSATLVPPAMVVAIQAIEALLAAEQGVLSFAVSYGQTGSIIQDFATARVLRTLVPQLLDRFGFGETQTYVVYHQWMGQFPVERSKAAALIVGSSIIGGMVQADKIVVKTVDEALGVPDPGINAEAIDTVRYALKAFACSDLIDSRLIAAEADLIHSETMEILDTVFSLPGHEFWVSVFQAFQLGYIDVPFSPHSENANRLNCTRDANRSIRILDRGNVPISDANIRAENKLICEVTRTSNSAATRLLSDIGIMAY